MDGFIVEFAGETIFAVSEHLAKLLARRLFTVTCSVCLSTVLHKDEKFAMDFTYDMNNCC